jgi:hypothetical protein
MPRLTNPQYYNLAVRNDFMSWVAPYRYSAVNDFKLKVSPSLPSPRLACID